MGKDCNEGLSKAGRRITPRASRYGDNKKKLRPPEDLCGRSRMPQSREGETQGPRTSSRKPAVLRSHSETRTEGADGPTQVQSRSGGIAAIVPGRLRPLAGCGGTSERAGRGKRQAAFAQAAFT